MPKYIPERDQATKEISHSFLLRRDVDLVDLRLEPREVAETAWMALGEFETQIRGDETYNNWVPHGRDYYLGALALVRQKLA